MKKYKTTSPSRSGLLQAYDGDDDDIGTIHLFLRMTGVVQCHQGTFQDLSGRDLVILLYYHPVGRLVVPSI